MSGQQATIIEIQGPLLRARTTRPFSLFESVQVGEHRLLGEVIRLNKNEITVQVYEDSTGLSPGDEVTGHGQPLSIPLSPAVLGGIFDGLLRPLTGFDTPFVPRGFQPKLDDTFRFEPMIAVGTEVAAGQPIAKVSRANAADQLLLTPPDLAGRVDRLVEAGEYTIGDVLCEIETPHGRREMQGVHHWPVRVPRPIAERLPVSQPLITGQRILDSLFPVALGGKAAVPGGFGTGKTVLLETLARWCSADVIVYVGCGERGNELTGMLEEFPQLVDPRNDRPLMERTVIIANTSNMPVAAREASIYTAITVAEYFRDQGLDVALMADSTSRWAEALREISGRLGELPGEAGYPAYLSSRLADFYERAARVRTLSGEEGSVTVMGTVSPPSGDFSEPVVVHTKRYVRCFWALDAQRAQARMYPAINPLLSYSEDADVLSGWWQTQGNSRWQELRRSVLGLLEDQVRLERMARIIGKDAMPYRQQLRLACAELVNDAFLRQSAFSEIDRYCSPGRQTAILELLMRFMDQAEQAVARAVHPDRITELPIYRRLQRMSEEIGEDQMETFETLKHQLDEEMQSLLDQHGAEEAHAG